MKMCRSPQPSVKEAQRSVKEIPRANPPDETPGCARSNIVEASQSVEASSDGTISPVGCRASVPEIAEIGIDTFGKRPE